MAYMSLAVALSAQAGVAIWWGGTQDTRVAVLERDFGEFRALGPQHTREIAEALRKVAVIEERLVRIDQNMDRVATAIEKLGDRAP